MRVLLFLAGKVSMKLTMKVLRRSLSFLLAIAVLHTSSVIAQDIPARESEHPATKLSLTSLLDIDGLTVDVDLKTLEKGGGLGVDFKIDYSQMLGDQKIAGNRLSLVLDSQGFVGTDADKTQNSIISKGAIQAELFESVQPLSPDEQAEADKIEADPEFQNAVLKSALSRTSHEQYLMTRHKALYAMNKRYVQFDAHVKDESDQSFDMNQVAFGAGASTNSNIFTGDETVTRILDLPFDLLRSAELRKEHAVEPIRFYAGYDYVSHKQAPASQSGTGDNDTNRLTAQAAWKTEIFHRMFLRASWQAYYDLTPDRAVRRADDEFTSFFETSLTLPISVNGSTDVILKYANGKLPPTLQQSSNVSLGFSVSF